MDILALISQFAVKYPWISTIFMIIGFLRVIFKPIFTFLRAIAEATSWTNKDDKIINDIESSKIYKSIGFALDYLASIKLPK